MSNKMKIYKSLLIAFLSGMSMLGYTQQSDSLMMYLEIAARNNPSVQQKFTQYKASLQKIPQAASLSDPELNMGFLLKPMELMAGQQVAEFQLMQMFPWFGVVKNAKDEMSLMAKANYESFRDAKLQVFFEVQQTWNELYKVKQSIRTSERNLDILHTLERLSMVRFKASTSVNGSSTSSGSQIPSAASNVPSAGSGSGMSAMGGSSAGSTQKAASGSSSSMGGGSMASGGGSGLADLYRIQLEIGELENNISNLVSLQNTIVARFNSYLNRPMQLQVAVPDTLIADSLNIPLEVVADSMLSNNPMLGMLDYEKQSLEARKAMVTRMGKPMVGVGINYTLINKSEMSTSEMNGKDMVMPMVKLTIPIYRKKYKAMQEEAELQKTATTQGRQATANALQTEYSEAVQNYNDALRRIKLYVKQNQLAHRSLNIMMKGYSSGGTDLTDLLRIRQQTFDYELQQVQAVADFNTAIAKLKRLMAYSPIQ
jgi:outer membrane protein TolC